MSYAFFKINKLKNEADFKKAIPDGNNGSITYYKCLDHVKKSSYYLSHPIRKNGVLALWLHFEYYFDGSPADIEKWSNASSIWAETNVINGKPYKCYSKQDSFDNHYILDLIYLSISPVGKLDFTNITNGGMYWLREITSSYEKYMGSLFGTSPAPSEIKKDFYLKENGEQISEPGKIPQPISGEDIFAYYDRIRSFEKGLNAQEKIKDEKIDSLGKKVDELSKIIENNEAALKRQKLLNEIIARYPDFRTMRKHLLIGRRIDAARDYYFSINDDESKETVDYIDTILKYGKMILQQKGVELSEE